MTALGRFPTSKTWQLGFLASRPPLDTVFQGYAVDTLSIPGGTYASLRTVGHPERLFVYWDSFKEWLVDDGYTVQSPVFEMYTGLLDTSVAEAQRAGELRFRISQAAGLAR